MLRNAFLFVATLLTLACASVGPKITPPVPEAPPAFATGAASLEAEPVTETSWWTRFEDPTLTQLVHGALTANHDVREAVQRVEAARAIRSETRQASLPGGSVSAARRNESAGRDRSTVATAGIDIGWELDLFGRVRNLKRAADADLATTEALLSQARVILAADVARTYFELRAAEERAAMLARYRADQAEVVTIIETRVSEGVDSEADLARARTVLAEDMLAVANEQHNVRVLRNALAVLIGENPGAWQPPAAGEPKTLAIEPIAIGDPAALLQRRPDVRAAGQALASQTADIGIASAALFPQVNIGGFFGLVAGSFGDLGASSGESWSIGPSVSWGIFDLGRVRAQVRRERAEAEGAVAVYERTVLRALEDTESAFSAFARAHEALGATHLQVRNARRAAELMQVRYEEGVSSYFELLDARRSSVRAEISRINGISAHRTATVDVFRALGTEPPVEEAAQ